MNYFQERMKPFKRIEVKIYYKFLFLNRILPVKQTIW